MKRLVLMLVTTFAAIVCGTTSAFAAPDRDPLPPPTDYWQDKGFILMAHQGGEWDFPPNTLFAYKSAIANGADMIDMDAYVTKDGKIVLTHDLDARKNSNLSDADFEGKHNINDLTLEQLKTLDFAYKWKPHGSSDETTPPWRGIATGSNEPPAGFTANDFKIPTFEEVLETFPDTPINIELKQVSGVNVTTTANTMASILAAHPGHDENVIINSFGQEMLDAVHEARPQHKSFGGSQTATLGYIQGGAISPTPVAVEPPDYYKLGDTWLYTVPILKPFTDYDGYKIFVWGSDYLGADQETPEAYAKLIAAGADSYNTPSPLTLARYLCENGIASPDGSPRCPEQECPEGQTGIAPDNCVDIPVPDLARVVIKGPKKITSGKKLKFRALVRNQGKGAATAIKVCVKAPKRLFAGKTTRCQTIRQIAAGKTGVLRFNLRTRKLRRDTKAKIVITAPVGKPSARSGGKRCYTGGRRGDAGASSSGKRCYTGGRRMYQPLLRKNPQYKEQGKAKDNPLYQPR